jgi:predicted O-methyltransferase YrrM
MMVTAKLFAVRDDALVGLDLSPARVLEIGTLAGDFADFMIRLWAPSQIVLIDRFDAQDYFDRDARFDPSTHMKFVQDRFSDVSGCELRRGDSADVLNRLIEEGRKFDFIYIDAGHTYADVSVDLALASQLLSPGGTIGMNDYIMGDYYYDTVYGVVQAVNEFLLANRDYRITGYALNRNLFADIYLNQSVHEC